MMDDILAANAPAVDPDAVEELTEELAEADCPPRRGGRLGAALDPGGDEVGDLGGAGVLEVVLAGDQLEGLVGRGQRVVDRVGVAREDAAVGERLDDERRHRDALEVRRAAALRRLEAPHREPGPQRARAADGERAEVGAAGIAGVATGGAVRGVEGEVGEPEVGPHPVEVEDAIPRPRRLEALELGARPRGDAVVAGHLGGPVALDELRRRTAGRGRDRTCRGPGPPTAGRSRR